MIEKEYGKYILSCDICCIGYELNSFDDAIEYKNSDGWESRFEEQTNLEPDWIDICPDCVEGGN